MVGFSVRFVFLFSRENISISSLFSERISSIEEEPFVVGFFEVNVKHDSVVLDIILDTEGIGVDEDVASINMSD